MGANRRLAGRDLLQARRRDRPEAATPVMRLMMLLFRLEDVALANAKTALAAHGLRFNEFEVLVSWRGAPPPHAPAPTDLYDPADLVRRPDQGSGVAAAAQARVATGRQQRQAEPVGAPDREGAGAGRADDGRRRARRWRIRRPRACAGRGQAPRSPPGEATRRDRTIP